LNEALVNLASSPPYAVSLRLLGRLGVVTAVLFLAYGVLVQAAGLYGPLSSDLDAKAVSNDFSMFYAGAELVTSGDRDDVYDLDTIVRRILLVRGAEPAEIPSDLSPTDPDYVWLRYYNPPIYLAAVSPLTSMSVSSAYLATVAVNVGLALCLAVIAGYILRWQQPWALFFGLAILGLPQTRVAIFHAQPTILIACLTGLGYLALRNGKTRLSGLLLSLTGVKPHWLIPVLTLLRAEKRLILPFFGGCLVFLALPFLVLGPSAIWDYAHLVLARGEADVNDPTYAVALLSWSGFFRALTGEPQPSLWIVASAATLLCFLLIVWRARAEVALAGGTLTALLVIPHSNLLDWVLLVPVSAILLSLNWDRTQRVILVLFISLLYLASNLWLPEFSAVREGGRAVYGVTLAAFGLLAWLVAVTYVDAFSRGRGLST
jgi:hypothetical protein